VRFVFDDEHLYVGARMYDDSGEEGVTSRLVRRDVRAESDLISIYLDPYLDHTRQVTFRVNPAGVRIDADDGDDSWDPVWRAKTRIDSEGWTAELAIPFSQLRFQAGEDQTWGLQITREINRNNEFQMWSFWREDQSGGPQRYGHLVGVSAPKAGVGRLELLPYVVAQSESVADIDPRDPFSEERESKFRFGGDLEYSLTSDLTLNATINPDFGQVEVDPAVVNLSAFETFFPEKREFFIADRSLFSFGNFWCFTCSNASSLSMLFTRRIGRSPQAVGLAFDAGDFADVPDNTTILGATKLTGRTRGGTSIGILGALTDQEEAEVFDGTDFFEQEIEPMTSYFVGRVTQDLFDGDLQVGGIATSVARRFEDPALEDLLPSHSEGFGVDAEWWWNDRTYHWLFSGAMTNVSGSEAAIERIQRSSARYFQRPDRDHGSNGFFTDRFDPTLESIRGYGLYSRLAKDAGAWRWETAINVRSPGFENNDIAFLTRTDYVWTLANVRRQWTTPTSWFRYFQWNVGAQNQFNYDGDVTHRQFHGNVFWRLPSYWTISQFNLVRPSTFDDRLTRGGPVVKSPAHGYHNVYVSSDSRKPVVASFNPSFSWNEEGARDYSLSLDVSFKPASNVSLSLAPRFSHSESTSQYVTAIDDPTAGAFFGRRYVFSDLEQDRFSMNTRLNWTFTPTMSLELFAQPFIASNDFSNFKEFAAPRALEKNVYGEDVGTIEELDGAFVIDPDAAGPAESFTVNDPDFNFRSLRGNLVYRWEYRPGSTLFLVWTQDRRSSVADGSFDFRRDVDELFEADADN
ncbi:MAG: DUF5916 domain-containing protein, partial [Halobacteriales archaeon]|nr:DUF5916 domain-containing protein [Halobacteriales archaeon]